MENKLLSIVFKQVLSTESFWKRKSVDTCPENLKNARNRFSAMRVATLRHQIYMYILVRRFTAEPIGSRYSRSARIMPINTFFDEPTTRRAQTRMHARVYPSFEHRRRVTKFFGWKYFFESESCISHADKRMIARAEFAHKLNELRFAASYYEWRFCVTLKKYCSDIFIITLHIVIVCSIFIRRRVRSASDFRTSIDSWCHRHSNLFLFCNHKR